MQVRVQYLEIMKMLIATKHEIHPETTLETFKNDVIRGVWACFYQRCPESAIKTHGLPSEIKLKYGDATIDSTEALQLHAQEGRTFKVRFIRPAELDGEQMQNRKKILIYNDTGTNSFCVEQAKYALVPFLRAHYKVKKVTAEYFDGDWEKETEMVIFPGGADRFYMEKLSGERNKKIRRFVENGGKCLGFCAGAYFTSDRFEFALRTPDEMKEERELKFFPGTAQGPHLASYDGTTKGARSAQIQMHDGEKLSVYYNGGCSFPKVEDPNVQEIARYATGEIAIVKCQVGLGQAILSGVHLEVNPCRLDPEDPNLSGIIPELKASNRQRVRLIQKLIIGWLCPAKY